MGLAQEESRCFSLSHKHPGDGGRSWLVVALFPGSGVPCSSCLLPQSFAQVLLSAVKLKPSCPSGPPLGGTRIQERNLFPFQE